MQNTINAGSGLKAMLDKRHLAVAGKFMRLLTLPDGTTQWSSAIPPRPNTKDAVQFVMKLDVTTANGVGPGTSGWARKMDEDLVGNLRYPGGVRVVSVDGDEDGNMYVSYEGCTGYNATALAPDPWGRGIAFAMFGVKEGCTKRLAKLWAVNGSEAWEVDARTTQRNATPAHCVGLYEAALTPRGAPFCTDRDARRAEFVPLDQGWRHVLRMGDVTRSRHC